MTGVDIPIVECKIILHQPTIEEISFIGESEFFIGVQTLCLNKSMFIEDKNDLNDISGYADIKIKKAGKYPANL